jgi:hypothetical protein
MTESIQLGRWQVRPDVPRTREAHAMLTRGGAAECSCTACANFEVVKAQFLAGPLGILLDRLGISPPFEVEVFEMGRAKSGLHHYGGWYHFVGSLESGADAWRTVAVRTIEEATSVAKVGEFERLSETLSFGLSPNAHEVRAPFAGLPLVQLEFDAELPWVIEAEEPA